MHSKSVYFFYRVSFYWQFVKLFLTAKSFQINDIFFYQFQCPEDDPLCDTEEDEYYNEEYNSPLLQPDPNMSNTELTLDNLDIPSLGKC